MPADDTNVPVETDAEAEAREQADFDSGMPEPAPKPARGTKAAPEAKADAPAAPEPKPAAAAPAPAPAPEYVRVTRKEWDDVRAAAAKTASYDAQFSKAFGTIGNLQKSLTGLQAAPPVGRKFEIPKDAFAGMERDFPELAQHYRAGLEAALQGVPGGAAEIDPEKMKQLATEHATSARLVAEVEALEEEHGDWRIIVGQVNVASGEQPDRNNPFRKWLATKPADYQAKLNSTNSAAVISRAISRFQSEVKTPAAALTLPAQLAASRKATIAAAVQPRGDRGAATAARPDEDDDFNAGFASR